MKKIIETLKYILFPIKCLSCNKYNDILCKTCIKKYIKIQNPEINSTSFYSFQNKDISTIIHKAKYHDSPELLKIFAPIMAEHIFESYCEYILSHKEGIVTLIPVPMHKRRFNTKGYNQALNLCLYIQEVLLKTYNIICLIDYKSIIKVKDIQLAKLPHKKDRVSFIKGAFEYSEGKINSNNIIYLVDDVITTGATMSEIEKLLNKNKIKVFEKVAIAH